MSIKGDSASPSTNISDSSEEEVDSDDCSTENDNGSYSSNNAVYKRDTRGRDFVSSTSAFIEFFSSNMSNHKNTKTVEDLTSYLANLERITIVVVEGLRLESQSPLLGAIRFSAIQSGVAAVEHILYQTLPRNDKERHAKIWGAIFKDLAWLSKITSMNGDPVVLGASIEDHYSANFWPTRLSTAFWVLLTGYSGQRCFEGDLFLSCLQPHVYDEKLCEIHFFNGLVLNVENVINENSHGQEIILTPRRIFRNEGSKKKTDLRSYYLYWLGDPRLHTLDSTKIQGLGGIVTKINQISYVCQISLNGNGKEHVYIFKIGWKSFTQAENEIEQLDLFDEKYNNQILAPGLYGTLT